VNSRPIFVRVARIPQMRKNRIPARTKEFFNSPFIPRPLCDFTIRHTLHCPGGDPSGECAWREGCVEKVQKSVIASEAIFSLYINEFLHGPPKAEEIAWSSIRTPRYEPHGSCLAMTLRGSFNSPMKQDSVSKETSLQDGEVLYLI